MIWRGQTLATYGQIGDAIVALTTREEVQEFIAAYEAETPHARANLGYMLGYYSRSTQERIYELGALAHPIFGRHQPTPQEALEMGQRLGERIKNGSDR